VVNLNKLIVVQTIESSVSMIKNNKLERMQKEMVVD
jgi:hypothetical protein